MPACTAFGRSAAGIAGAAGSFGACRRRAERRRERLVDAVAVGHAAAHHREVAAPGVVVAARAGASGSWSFGAAANACRAAAETLKRSSSRRK